MTLTLMRQLKGTSFEALKDPFAFGGAGPGTGYPDCGLVQRSLTYPLQIGARKPREVRQKAVTAPHSAVIITA
jgi:hypothetical protein